MKKNKIIGIILISLLLLYLGIYLLQNLVVTNYLNNYWYSDKSKKGKKINQSEVVRCNWDILNPKFTFVSDHLLLFKYPELKIYFYQLKNIFIGNFDKGYIGTTGIKNSTFPQILKMVKEDCDQFQKDYDNPKVKEGGIDWGYREYDREVEEYREKEDEMIREYYKIRKIKYTEKNFKIIKELLKAQVKVKEDEKKLERMLNSFKEEGYIELGGDTNWDSLGIED